MSDEQDQQQRDSAFIYDITNATDRKRQDFKSPERQANIIETDKGLSVKELANIFSKKPTQQQTQIRLTHYSEKQNHLYAEMIEELRAAGSDKDIRSLIEMFQKRINNQSTKSTQDEQDFWNNLKNNATGMSRDQLEDAMVQRSYNSTYQYQSQRSFGGSSSRFSGQDAFLSGLDFGGSSGGGNANFDLNQIISDADNFRVTTGGSKKASRKLNLLELAEQELQIQSELIVQQQEQVMNEVTDGIVETAVGKLLYFFGAQSIRETMDKRLSQFADQMLLEGQFSYISKVIEEAFDEVTIDKAIPSVVDKIIEEVVMRDIFMMTKHTISNVRLEQELQKSNEKMIDEAVGKEVQEIIKGIYYENYMNQLAEVMYDNIQRSLVKETLLSTLIERSIDFNIFNDIMGETMVNLITDICKEACVQQYQVRKTVNNNINFIYLDFIDNELRKIMLEAFKEVKEQKRSGHTIFDELFDDMLQQEISMVASSALITAKVRNRIDQEMKSPARSQTSSQQQQQITTRKSQYDMPLQQQAQPRGSSRMREQAMFTIRQSSKSPMRESVTNRVKSSNRTDLKSVQAFSQETPINLVDNKQRPSSTMKYDQYFQQQQQSNTQQQQQTLRNQPGIQPSQGQRSNSREKGGNYFQFGQSPQVASSQPSKGTFLSTQQQKQGLADQVSKDNLYNVLQFDPEKIKERLRQKFSQMKKKEEDDDDDWDINEGATSKLPQLQNQINKRK